MMNAPTLPASKSFPDIVRDFSAKEFVNQMAAQLQRWLDDQVLNKKVEGMQFFLTVPIAGGQQVTVYSLSALGQSLVRINGELSDGRPCLFFSHQNSIQFLAGFSPRTQEQKKRRE